MNRLGKRRDTTPVGTKPKISRTGNVELYISNPPNPTQTQSGLMHLACAYNHKSDLLLVYGWNTRYSYHILTPEGYLVTLVKFGYIRNSFEYPQIQQASFSDEQILIEIFKYVLFLSTDYLSRVINHKGSVFDCDDNGNIYISINHERRIAIHSSDFIFKGNFPEYPTQTGEMIALTVKGDFMVVLSESTNYSKNNGWKELIKIHKYSLTTEKLIQKCIITDLCSLVPDLFFIDKFGNILLMEQRNLNKYCVLYEDGRVCSYSLGNKISTNTMTGFCITNNLELIVVFRIHYICVYNISIS